MVKSKSSLSYLAQVIHSAFVIFWLSVSTAGFGIAVIFFSFFSSNLSNLIVRLWGRLLISSAGIKLEIKGLERLEKGKNYIFVANHLSVFDIPALYAVLPYKIGFIAKKELFKIPLFGRIMLSSNSLPVDRGSARQARKSLDMAIEKIKKNRISIVVFPEGTRSISGDLGAFKQASFTLPIESEIDIVPIALSGGQKILQKDCLVITPGTIKGKICTPIKISEGVQKSELSETVKGIINDAKNELERAA